MVELLLRDLADVDRERHPREVVVELVRPDDLVAAPLPLVGQSLVHFLVGEHIGHTAHVAGCRVNPSPERR